mgnify:CR=1 FL=1
MPIDLDKGSQKTEKPYAIPMLRWINNAAGGINQRLKPGLAMVFSFDKNVESDIYELPFLNIPSEKTAGLVIK